MFDLINRELVFKPATELPTADLDESYVIVLNPCDGWHIGTIHAFEEDGEVYQVGIYTSFSHEVTPHDFYIAWALLPDSLELSELFESERKRS